MTAARPDLDAAVLRWANELPDHFRARVTDRLGGHPDPDSCWTWPTPKRDGYGQVVLPRALGLRYPNGKSCVVYVHRAMWLATVGPIGDRLLVDHDDRDVGCHNRACGNPAHLVLSTNKVNVVVNGTGLVADQARRTHCPQGHPLDGPDADLERRALAQGARVCRVCGLERDRQLFVLLGAARRVFGLTWSQYRGTFGQSADVAEGILTAAIEAREEIDETRAALAPLLPDQEAS